MNRLVGLVVKVSTSRAADLDVILVFAVSDLKIGTPVVILPGAWRYMVSAETGWPGVSIL